MTIQKIIDKKLLDNMITEFINKNDKYFDIIDFELKEDKQFKKKYVSIKVKAKDNVSLFGFEHCTWIDFDKKEITGTISFNYFECYRTHIKGDGIIKKSYKTGKILTGKTNPKLAK